MTKPVYVLNGPNLNLLGVREPHIYGHETLGDVETLCHQQAAQHGFEIRFRQSNHEGEIVSTIQEARDEGSGIIINPAAYTHTSVAIHDALRASDLPVIELHLSNPHTREEFRHRSFVSPIADAIVCGFGAGGYALAVDGMAQILDKRAKNKAA